MLLWKGMTRIMRNNAMTAMTEIVCSYAEKPHAILKLIRLGYSIDDINIVRIDTRTYSVWAKKKV